MKSALFLSPHMDDVVFSCGATLALCLERGWNATVITVFTGNVRSPQGFALQCQTSKGLAPEIDYMALRRNEDFVAFSHLGNPILQHWDFLEAPHRGYDSPSELFAGAKTGDAIAEQIREKNERFIEENGAFDAVFAPQGLGNHVDHWQVIRAARAFSSSRIFWYRDTPYALREPDSQPCDWLPNDLETVAVAFDERVLERKIAACCAYESQIGFQFGGARAVREKLTAFHRAEAQKIAANEKPYAELFLANLGATVFF